MNTLLLTANVGAMGVLQVLRDEILIRLRSLELEDNDQMVVQIRNQNMEDSLLKWGEQHGVKTKLQIACKCPDKSQIVCHTLHSLLLWIMIAPC